ncbi:MAG: hypothetical protein LBL94_02330 [Prevotellaceae bacterium]|jgi:uncharacterized protein (UPF0332 family)|nr:hypothetical protein [Prevotellaceae bacterium]
MPSHLQRKSEALSSAATLLHEKELYPAVAHSAYYSCYQLMMHIWLLVMKRSERELTRQKSSHEYLIIAVREMIKKSNPANFYAFNGKIWMLKQLRTNADYSNTPFGKNDSAKALSLSADITPILKKYWRP